MISDGVAEIIMGMTVDAQFGQVLVIGAGGVLTELLRDTATLLPPFTPTSIEAALNRLKVSKLLRGFRGKPAGDIPALIDTVLACTRYAQANLKRLVELDINPVIVRPARSRRCRGRRADPLIRAGVKPCQSSSPSKTAFALPATARSSKSRSTARRRTQSTWQRAGGSMTSSLRSATIPSVLVAIVTGSGEKFFSPGWDLKAAAAGEESDSDWGVGGFAGFNYPRNLNKPIIAAVNGIACGGGFEIVLGTDIIVMEEHAKFALPEINVAVLADAATIKLRRRIPYHVAVEFLMTGRWMDAAEAKHWGICNHVVPKGQGLAKAREIARQLADGPPLLYPAIKQLLRHSEMIPEHEAFGLHDSLAAV